MKTLKTVLTLVIIAALLLAGGIALFWKQLLTPQQKLNYGLYVAAADDYLEAARANPQDSEALAAYVDVLVSKGNLGRAAYLSELYGVDHQLLAQLREAAGKCLKAGAKGEAYRLADDPATEQVTGLPVREVLRYLDGYQHALLGDWATARNYFKAIDTHLLPPELKPYRQYYLARSYRLAGTDEEQEHVEQLLLGVVTNQPDLKLRARARYNLIAWYLSGNDGGEVELGQAQDQNLLLGITGDTWALQKSDAEFARYYIDTADLKRAWEHAARSLVAAPAEAAGGSAGKLCLEIIELELGGGQFESRPEFAEAGAFETGMFSALADSATSNGFAAAAAASLKAIEQNYSLTDAQLEELYTAQSGCYLAEENSKAMSALMAVSNLAGFSSASLADIYYNNAVLLKRQEQWNKSLDYFLSAAKLNSDSAGESWFGAYSILKQVQQRLDVPRATEYLSQVVTHYPESSAFPGAVEELIPLLIYSNQADRAVELCDYVLGLESGSTNAELRRTFDQTREVALYWQAYVAEQRGDPVGARSLRNDIPLQYWNYYELTSNYPPEPELDSQPSLLQLPEHCGEYLLGLGLTDSALSAWDGAGISDRQLLYYLDLRNRSFTRPVSSQQWHATGLLEDGLIAEQALLEYVLDQAYPRPWDTEVKAAAAEFDVSEALIYAIMKKESTFKPESVSWVGAQGLMQLMPNTSSWLNGRYSLKADLSKLMEPAVNIRLGGAYIRSLLDDMGENNIRGVIHTYNGGPGNYARWRENYPVSQVLFTDVVPNEQNEVYAKKVIKYYKVYEWLGSR